MNKNTQTIGNLDLSEDLMIFMRNNAERVSYLPTPANYIMFTQEDSELNEKNEKLIHVALNEDKPVIKAVKKKRGDNAWEFTILRM